MRPVGNTLSLSRTSQMVSEQLMELMTVLLVSTVITAHSASHSSHGGHTGKQDFSNTIYLRVTHIFQGGFVFLQQ